MPIANGTQEIFTNLKFENNLRLRVIARFLPNHRIIVIAPSAHPFSKSVNRWIVRIAREVNKPARKHTSGDSCRFAVPDLDFDPKDHIHVSQHTAHFDPISGQS